ncbi:sortase family protein [Actinomycetospora succinea]|uniref:Sortase family protein n=1 Tax=Actinomycetospora succinea TaxID=663603 RepID=A0A4R6URR2_9PSEU|nr:class F sortase [Actinomycetospora succinea]TDQ48916.1 sortase family protein [Actinomycetospora succinea]
MSEPDQPVETPTETPRRRWSRRPLVWIALAVAVLAVVGVTVGLGVRTATADAATGMLRIAHLSPVTPSVDMYVAGPDLPETLVAPGVGYRGTSPYLTEPAGTYTLTARPAGAAPESPPAVRVSLEVPAGTAQTAAFVDSTTTGAPELQVLDDQTAPAPAGSAQVRVVQGANGVGALDVGLLGGPPLAGDLFYGSTTPYVTVPAREWRVDIRSRLGSTNRTTVTLPDSGVTTLFVGREPDGQLIVEAVPDAATVAGVPAPGTEPTTPQATPTPRPTPDPETPLPAAPRVPPVPRGGTEAGLGGLATPTLLSAVGDWFSGLFTDETDVPPAPRMPLAAALAAPEGLRPTGMQIPSIGLAALQLTDLRIDYRGALQVPTDFGQVGWYTSSAVPGDPGPAVFAGHVDTRRGPAVFAQLDRLRPGDMIEVPRSDGETARFSVDSVEYFPKDTLPSDRIYGPATSQELRLLTCGGPFDERTLSYRDNVVVFASVR